jgi:hypothetical protein
MIQAEPVADMIETVAPIVTGMRVDDDPVVRGLRNPH